MFLFLQGRCLEVWGEVVQAGICLRITSLQVSVQTRAGSTILTTMPDELLSDQVPQAPWGDTGAVPPPFSC